MKKLFQAWCEEEEGCVVSISLGTVENITDQRARGLLSSSARLMYEIVADTPEEAMAVHYIKQGRNPYHPMGTPQKCPKGCGNIYYPEESGECPNCGPIC
jgi:hypothetical protein